MDTNCCIFTGRLTRDAELKTVSTGLKICNFSMAFSEITKDSTNPQNHIYRPNYIDCVIYGGYGEALFPILKKGREVTITSRLHQERWQKDGKNFSRIVFYVNNLIAQREPKSQIPPVNQLPPSDVNGNLDYFEPQEV